MIPHDDAVKYAELLVRTGLDLQPGQKLLIGCEPVHWDFAVVVAEQAYKAGATYVTVDAPHPKLMAARVQHGAEEDLEYLPDYVEARMDEFVEQGWVRLRIAGQEFPDLVAGLAADRVAKLQRRMREAGRKLMRAAQANEIAWCVAAAPTPAWQQQVFGEQAQQGALWEAMRKILRLDVEDPAARWDELGQILRDRASLLSEMGFDALRLRDEDTGTDLTVGLHEGSSWMGGGAKLTDGRPFMPNLPTEEVFTTPDFRRVEGELVVTRPVEVMGQQVHGARFTFEEGKVVKFTAQKGEQALQQMMDFDEQARFAGELALVDSSSPIQQSGLVFSNILYDENASCHLALGSAYPNAVPGATEWDTQQRLEAGVNESLVHTDFMFGTQTTQVFGVAKDGSEKAIIRDGTFVI